MIAAMPGHVRRRPLGDEAGAVGEHVEERVHRLLEAAVVGGRRSCSPRGEVGESWPLVRP